MVDRRIKFRDEFDFIGKMGFFLHQMVILAQGYSRNVNYLVIDILLDFKVS